MTTAIFLTITGPDDLAGQVQDRIESHILPAFRQRGQINAISLFTPAPGQEDPYVKDEAPPALIIQIDADDLAHGDPLFADDKLMHMVEGAATCDAFRTVSYPIKDIASPGLRTAPISFNVRYHAPVEDEQQFVDHYLAGHPPILCDLPGVRNVFCYVPIPWDAPAAIPRSDCILGNEVVFNSLDALNEALASDVRHRLRDDYNSFPVRPGPNTHCAMHRQDFKID